MKISNNKTWNSQKSTDIKKKYFFKQITGEILNCTCEFEIWNLKRN